MHRHVLAALIATTGALTACSGSSAPRATSSSPPASPTAVLSSAPGGLVGVIDAARVQAVCINLRQASTALGGGVPAAEVDRFVTASADQLDRPPRVRAAVILAATLRAAVRRGDEAAAVREGTAWCAQHGG